MYIKSKTKMKQQLDRKTSPVVSATITLALKQKAWNHLAHILSGATRNYAAVNLGRVDAQTKMGDTVIVPGKIVGSGELTKKVRLCALGISAGAHEKLKKTKSEYVSISDEIKLNPKAEGVKILR